MGLTKLISLLLSAMLTVGVGYANYDVLSEFVTKNWQVVAQKWKELFDGKKIVQLQEGTTLLEGVSKGFEGCTTCHPKIAEKMKAPNRHAPFAKGDCAVCHKPHDPLTGKAEYTLPLVELCSTCHNRYKERQNPYQHYPFKTGKCVDCHDPHGSDQAYNLRLPVKVLCNSCHNMAVRYLDKKVQHSPFVNSECTSCHSPHSSPNPRNLRAPVEQICNTCHFATLPGQYAEVKHSPFKDGRCIECHNPHASDNVRMLRKPVPDLCLSCHPNIGFQQERMHPIGDKYPDRARGGQVSCASCHHPHGTGNQKMWLRPGNFLCFGCHASKLVPEEVPLQGYSKPP